MEYKRYDNAIVLRLDPNEDIVQSLLHLAAKEDIALAIISGLGAIDDFTVGVFDTKKKIYHSNHFEGAFEIVSLTGTLTRQEGKPYLHVHLSAGDKDGKVFGGHLNSANVSATAEIVVSLIPGAVEREFSDTIGLNLMKF